MEFFFNFFVLQRFKRDGWNDDLKKAIEREQSKCYELFKRVFKRIYSFFLGNETEVLRLIEAGASIDAVDEYGKSLFHYAAEYG